MFYTLSGILFLYVLVRGVLPLRVSPPWKIALGALVFVCAFKVLFVRHFFGQGPAVEMPWWGLALSAWANAFVVLLALFLILRDAGLTLALPVRRRRAKAARAARNAASPEASDSEKVPETAGTGAAETPADPRVRPTTRYREGMMAAAGLLGGMGVWAALRVPDVHRVTVSLARLPAALDGLRLVQLSDLHISAAFPQEWTQAVVDRVNALTPDLTVITGDLIDGTPWRRRHDVAPLAQLRARHGVFACVGNHEYYSGLEPWVKKFRELGLVVLRDEHRVLRINGAPLVLAGVSDVVERRYGRKGPDVRRALAGSPSEAVRILLEHQPLEAWKNARLGVDLQLSGHTHGGQILIANLLVAALNNGFLKGLYHVGDMRLYVSPGTGLWGGFPLRVLVPAEITEITLRRA